MARAVVALCDCPPEITGRTWVSADVLALAAQGFEALPSEGASDVGRDDREET